MTNSLRTLTPALLFALFTLPFVCAQQPEPPAAPLPATLASAHRLFLGNAGDQENADCLRAYNSIYAGLQQLGRYQLVASPADADLALILHYEAALGQAIATNDSNRSVRQFRVALLDPRSGIPLWSITEGTNYALLQANRNKNLDETTAKLVIELGALLSSHPEAPNGDSKVKHGLHF